MIGTTVAVAPRMFATRAPLLLLAMTACVAPVDEAELDQQLVGATQATPAEFPTVVGLLSGGNNWFCTGVLVDKAWVMTAASCFENTSTAQVRLDDGTLGDSGGKTVAVTEIRKHPEFDINSATWNHDIAMLALATPVTDRTPSVIRRDPVALATQVTQVGYGVRDNNNNGGGQLRSLSTTTLDCGQANDGGITNANLLCFDASDGTGSCYGDGGAPSLVGPNKAVAGLGSGGTGSSCTRGLDVYTAISAEVAFIDSVLPQATTPPTDPTPPPADPTNPDAPGDPVDADDDDTDRPPQIRGCSTGGGAGGLVALGLALLALRRKR